MKCKNCNINLKSFYYREKINGKDTWIKDEGIYKCPECKKRYEITPNELLKK